MNRKKQWILVTGAAKGVGRAICQELAKKGHSLVIHYNTSTAQAEELQKSCLAAGAKDVALCQGDFTTQESTQTFIQAYKAQFSATYAIINNVGIYERNSFWQTDPLIAADLLHINVWVPFFLIQQLGKSITEAKGHIITIGTSGITSYRANTYATLYTASKQALWSMTKSLAKELADKGVQVNMVSPGKLENSSDCNTAPFPMGRPGTFEEVASVVSFLLDKKNRYITGQNIEVAGALGL